jgi:C4-dicarboxylate-specific signal transduction histidine kinase
MKKIKFEYRITLAYLFIGIIWILFSDRFLNSIIHDNDVLTEIQTYKGWLYVFVTGLLFFLFLKNHLRKLRLAKTELQNHRNNLQQLVLQKTKDLDLIIENLSEKNKIIITQNETLNNTLQDLKNTQSQLLQADKMASLGVLTAGIAHEINNPLNYILGGLTGLENFFNEKETENKRVKLFLISIKTGIDKISSIVSGLNKLNRNIDTYDEDCDIHEIIENCLLIVSNQLNNRIKINRNYSDKNIIVLGNVGQLHQVFLNILINAIQSINEDGIISIETKLKNEFVYLKISDTGCGINPENISKITEPFFTTKEPGKGTGLGLSISYNIIVQHKGSIEFISQINKGTIVKIVLPLKNKNYE